jgi:uroporphyrinogen-III synthase
MRVLVTRPKVDAQRTAGRLRALGHEALLAPLLEVAATTNRPPVEATDAILVTSAHAAAALRATGDRDRPVFAVGERSAAAIRSAGFGDVRAGDGDAAGLAALVARSLPKGSTLLHVAGRDRKSEPEASLLEAGYAVRVWEAYEAVAARVLPDAVSSALTGGRIDGVLHYSRRSAALLVDLVDRAGLRPHLRSVAHFCLSADVAVPLASLDAVVRIAAEPHESALLAALDAFPPAKGSRRPAS